MQPETMTAEERIWAAINLQECDRVPVGFPLTWFAASHAGITMADYANDCDANVAASYKLFQDLGGFDVITLSGIMMASLDSVLPMKTKVPGRDLPPDSITQADEKEVMTSDEYDIIIDKGWSYYEKEYLSPRIRPGFNDPSVQIKLEKNKKEISQAREKETSLYSDKDVILFEGTPVLAPFEVLSMARSFNPFLLDFYQRPDKVIAAMDVMLPETINTALSKAKASHNPFTTVPFSRSSCAFISPEHFKKFVLPQLKKITEALVAENFAIVFHLDQDWIKFLPYFRELPEGRYVIQLDGATDIFEAKNIVGDRMCIMGDVPARLMKMGTIQKIEQYCQKLIDIVGKGSGFILGAG